MVKRIFALVVVLSGLSLQMLAQCPGFNKAQNDNLACQIVTTVRTPAGSSLQSLSPTLASQLAQLPIASAVSGSGVLVFSGGVVPTVKGSESLGTILTQRGETVGRHKLFVSFNYQRFNFDKLDGEDLNALPTVNQGANATSDIYQVANVNLGIKVDQFTGLASFGLTNRIDVSVIVPFSHVTLFTQQANGGCSSPHKNGDACTYFVVAGTPKTYAATAISNPFPDGTTGTATGIGDIIANVKANVFKSSDEQTNIAIGGEVRFPTGDEFNYLGTGAYGVKPYIVVSRAGKRFSPNFNFGYQWNGTSALYQDVNGTSQNLPSTLLYSAGMDIAATKRLTFVGEYLGYYVIDGPRIMRTTAAVPMSDTTSENIPTIATTKEGYAMNNVGVGLKFSPIKHLLISGNALIAVDTAGLRARVTPLVGVSYRF